MRQIFYFSKLWIYLIIASGLIMACESSSENSADQPSVNPEGCLISSLLVSPGVLSPEFDPQHKNYILRISADVMEVTFRINCDDNFAISIQNKEILSGTSNSINVSNGDIIPVVIKSQAGSETLYSISVQMNESVPAWQKDSSFEVSSSPGGVLSLGEWIYVHRGTGIYKSTQSGEVDTNYGQNGKSESLTSSAMQDVGISIDQNGNVYVPTSGDGNVEMVSSDGSVSKIITDAGGAFIDLGLVKGVAVNSAGNILYLAQAASGEGLTRGIYRFEKIEGKWLISSGAESTTVWGNGGILSHEDLNSSMRSLSVFADGRILISCGSRTKKIFEITNDGLSVRKVVDLSSTGENCGETGSCNFFSVFNDLLYIAVVNKSEGNWSGIRIYKINEAEYTFQEAVSYDSANGITFPGDGSGEEIRGISAISEKMLIFGSSDNFITKISYR